MDGQPFFMINKAVDPGLLKVIEEEIVPRLERDLPQQQELFAGLESAPRFTLVFDREGYSPGFMSRMQKKGISCLTYHKYPGEDWPESEFREQKVTLVSGNEVTMQLAVYWFSVNWNFRLSELVYSNGGKFHGKETQKVYP